jgi:hypothetical protein
MHFFQFSRCHSVGVRTRVVMEETDALTDRPHRFERNSVFTESLRSFTLCGALVIHCYFRKEVNKTHWKSKNFPAKGVVFVCFQMFDLLEINNSSDSPLSLRMFHHRTVLWVSTESRQVSRFSWLEIKQKCNRNSRRKHLFTHSDH